MGVTSPLEVSIRVTQVIERNLAGDADLEELREACRAATSELDRVHQGFLAVCRAKPRLCESILKPEVEAVSLAFADYAEVLKTCTPGDDGSIPQDWDLPLINLRLANSRLSLMMLRFRDCLLSEQGPTTHPGINHLLSLGSGHRERFEAVWEEEMIRARSALEELEQETDLGAALYSYNLSYLSLLEELPMGSDKLSPWLGELRRLGLRYAMLDFDFFTRHHAGGPTHLTWLNIVVQAAWQVAKGKLNASLFERVVDVAAEQLEAMQGRHRIYQEGLTESAPEWEPAQRAEGVLEGLRELVEGYRLWAHTQSDPPSELIERAERLASELDRAAQDIWNQQTPSELGAAAWGERLLEAAEAACRGEAGASQLRKLLLEVRAPLEIAIRQGGIKPERLVKADLQQVEQLQANYCKALLKLSHTLDSLDSLAQTPASAAYEQMRPQLEEATAEVEHIYETLSGLTRQENRSCAQIR